jgi:hypothetical protein
MHQSITTKTAGRFGEHAVQAELERQGWSTCNLNKDHPNAPAYDILAWKEELADNDQPRTLPRNHIYVRVKTSRPLRSSDRRTFVFNIEKKDEPPSADGIEPNDFTVLVGMGEGRNDDEFWVLPTDTLRKEMRDKWVYFFGKPTRQGTEKVKAGMLTLYFYPAPKGENRPGYDLAKKWECYHDNWEFTRATCPSA